MTGPSARNLGLLLLGLGLNAMILLLPTAACGHLTSTARDGAAWLLLLLISLFCGLEIWLTLCSSSTDAGKLLQEPAADRTARHLAHYTGLVTLTLFCGALFQRGGVASELTAWQLSLGTGMMLMGTALRAAAIRQLGARFRTEVVLDAGHALKRNGIYRWIRHPSETGLLAATLGACLMTGWWIGVAIWACVLAPLVLCRVVLEERCLEAVHGETYREYKRQVRRFLPGIC